MIINFKKENAGILNVPHGKTPEELKREGELSAEKRSHRTPKFTSIVPGVNDIPDKKWNLIKDNERIKAYRASGELVVLHSETIPAKPAVPAEGDTPAKEGTPEKELSSKTFKELTSEEQEVLIKDCEILKQLKAWKKITKESNQALLADKIDRIEHPEKYNTEEE